MIRPILAFTWEFWRLAVWHVLFAIIAGVLFDLFAVGTAAQVGRELMNGLQVILLAAMTPLVVHAAFIGTGFPHQKFTLPTTTTQLVLSSLAIGSFAIVASYSVIVLIQQRTHGIAWPLLKPAAYSIVTFIWCHGLCWTLRPGNAVRQGAVWIVALIVPGIAAEPWATAGVFTNPWQNWWSGEQVLLAIAAVLGILFDLRMVESARLGEPRWSEIVWRQLVRIADRVLWARTDFRSPQAAEAWYEWRKKGIALPAFVAAGTLVATVCLLSGAVPRREALGMVGGMCWLIVAGSFVLGGYLGHCGPNFDIPAFKATRPLTDTQLADGILLNVVKSVSLSWAIWFVGTGLSLLVMFGSSLRVVSITREQAIYVPLAFIVAGWSAPAIGASLFLCTRRMISILTALFLWVPAAAIILINFSSLSLETAQRCQIAVGWTICCGIILSVIAIYLATLRLRLIGGRRVVGTGVIVAAALAIFGQVTGAFSPASPLEMVIQQPLLGALWVCCGLAPALPFAATPLAMWWIRHRV